MRSFLEEIGYSLPIQQAILEYVTQIFQNYKPTDILKRKTSNLGFHTAFTEVIAHQHLLLRNFAVSSLQVSRYYFPYWTAMNALVHHQPSFSFWIKAKLVQLYYAINTYSKNTIPYIPQSENYEIHFSLKTSGAGI